MPQTKQTEPDLFAPADPVEGLKYAPAIVTPDDERELIERFADLPFKAFEFHGYVGNRRVVSFGWHYDFAARQLAPAEDMPAFLLPLRERAAEFGGVAPADLQHALITEYQPGAGIGWHKDKAVFGTVIGVSLMSACVLRFRRKAGTGWQRHSLNAEPRSAYLLQGPSRTEWEHSIASVDALRYSVTFRDLRS